MPTGRDGAYDVVIAGSGAAALTAAVTAAAKGLKPLIVEKTGFWGGTTAYSGGGVWIPANPVLLADGQSDSIEEGLTYLESIIEDAGPASSPERKLAFLRNGPELVRFLAEQGFEWQRTERYPDYYPDRPGGHIGRQLEGRIFDGKRLGVWLETLRRRPGAPPLAIQSDDLDLLVLAFRTSAGFVRAVRVLGRTAGWRLIRRVPLASGLSLVGQLMAIAQRSAIPVWLNSPLRQLIIEDGRVTGAVVQRDARTVHVRANAAVILAAGGFARNDGYRRRFQPVGGEWSSAARGDTGDAIQAGIDAGAATALMDDAWWGTSFITPEGARTFCLWERSLPGAIIVDQTGERFVNESTSYVDVGHALLERNRTVPAVPSWLIMDARHRRRYPFGTALPGVTPRRLVESGFLVKAVSIDELAQRTGIDSVGLRRTVARFNRFAAAGVDEDFGRGNTVYDNYYGDPRVLPNPNLAPIVNPPFWAARIYPGDLGTKGGLLTDEHARALRDDGEPIPGLYAAGNTAATVMGRTYPGPGGTLGPAMVFAYIAANHLATTVGAAATARPDVPDAGRRT